MATALHRHHVGTSARPVSRTAARGEERPLWKDVLILYSGIFVLAVLLMTACFVAARVAG